jgi:nitrate reductase gamma subunit
LVAICKEEKKMDKQTQKIMAIVAGSVAGAALLGGAFYMIWNSKQVRAMRTVHRTNMILRRVGNVLCKIAAADEACV